MSDGTSDGMNDSGQARLEIDVALAAAVASLSAADATSEALARYEPRRRQALLFTRDARLVPVGRVWRLGVFLLSADGSLYATGHTTRAVNPRHPGYQSVSAEERRDYRATAFRGPFESGETVNFDAELLVPAVSSESDRDGWAAREPLVVRDGHALVRWSAAAPDDALRTFGSYLTERVDLLLGR